MKKIVSVLLILSTIIALCGCGKSQKVKETEAAIEQIGAVSLNSGSKISVAETLFYALSEKEQKKVNNRDLLLYSRTLYDMLRREDYYNALCLCAERKDLDGIRSVLKQLKYGDSARKVAIMTQKEAAILRWDSVLNMYWIHYYNFDVYSGAYSVYGLGCDSKDFEGAAKSDLINGKNNLDVLYLFDLK